MIAPRDGGRLIVALFIMAVLALAPGLHAQTKDAKKDPKKEPAKKEVPPPAIALSADCQRPDAMFKLDEDAVFLLASNTGGEIEFTMTEDGLKVIRQGKLRVTAGQTYKLEGRLPGPGFLRLHLTQGTAKADAVAAFEPTKIQPTAKAPDDFDEFWQNQLKLLAKERVDAAVESWPKESSATVTTLRVNLGMIDERRVYGWVAIPKGPGPFPAILTMPYAGVYGIAPDHYHANMGAIAMNIIIHDFQADFPPEFYKKQAAGPLKDYNRIGWEDREKSYFRYAILSGVRALDYLVTRKEYNGKELAVTGTSQGGALALCLSGLDERVKFVAPNVAGLCDLNARSVGRIDGWPHWALSAPPELREKVEKTSEYFDAVNFARKFKGKSVHGVGFLDTACPPSTVYAAFNVHPEPKVIINSPRMGHGTDPRWTKAREDFWKENLTLKPPPLPVVPPKKK